MWCAASVSVPAGKAVTFTNDDDRDHRVTADDSSFDSNDIATGSTFSQAFSTAGTFKYHCKIHSTMTATITVK